MLRALFGPPLVFVAAFALGLKPRRRNKHGGVRKLSWLRRFLLLGGAAGVIAGASLLSIGLYRSLSTAEDPVQAEAAVFKHLNDPGAVYDRPQPAPPTPAPTATPAPSPTPAPVVAGAARPPLRESSYRLIIERIGVNSPVYTYGLDANRVPQVPYNAWDVAWYDFSAAPGTGGNAVFAGHVTWNGPAVFYNLDQLAPGDRIVLKGMDGTQLVYTVTSNFLVDPSDPDSLSVMAPTDSDVITLITCGGTFYYTGDPIFNGDYTHRRVVRAALESVNVASAPAAAGG